MISAIIITKNEERNIRDCLLSLQWVDEIIIVDSGSTDRTLDIAKSFTDKIYHKDWEGFGKQKNYALSLATHDWVLSLDADERIPSALQTEIKSAISDPSFDGYNIKRRSSYCGRFMKFGGWGKDHVLRLFRKDKASFSDSLVHERLILSGKIGQLKSPLIHYSFPTVEDVIHKMNLYSSLGAEEKYLKGQQLSLSGTILRAWWTFIKTYFIKLGFLDGKQGFMLAVSNAEGVYYKYIKLMMLYKNVK